MLTGDGLTSKGGVRRIPPQSKSCIFWAMALLPPKCMLSNLHQRRIVTMEPCGARHQKPAETSGRECRDSELSRIIQSKIRRSMVHRKNHGTGAVALEKPHRSDGRKQPLELPRGILPKMVRPGA